MTHLVLKPRPVSRFLALACVALSSLVLSACLSTAQPMARTDELPFDQAVDVAADALSAQMKMLPAFLAKVESSVAKRSIVIDATLDSATGQQTALTKRLDQRLAARLGVADSQFTVMPFQASTVGKASYLVTGTISRLAGVRSPFQIQLALTDLKTSNVVAQASSRARDEGFDLTPTAYYLDSPTLIKDQIIDGQIKTSKTAPGNPSDTGYIKQISYAPLLSEAKALYNNQKYDEALALYLKIPMPGQGEQLELLNGLYLTYWKKGLGASAEPFFGRMVALGLRNNNLTVKFLFVPGKTEFETGTGLVPQYALWIRQLARQVSAAKVCMNVVGHTSNTGTMEYNNKLSAARAKSVADRLAAEAPELGPRLRTSGVGFAENIVGTGTDNLQDAQDRRVAFKVEKCA